MPELVLSLDAGTTGITALVVDPSADVRARSTSEFTQSYPQPGWVEHDPEEIWTVARAVMSKALDAAGITAADLAAVGITNQRETVVLWDRATGDPVAPAIVWQDRRTASLCDRLRAEGHEDDVRTRTGLVLDPYFSGTKLTWLLENVAGARARAEAGELAFGTIDTWLLWKLSGGTVHVTEPSNASRTLLYSLAKGTWDPAMLELLDIPPSVLPSIQTSSGRFTETTTLGKVAVPIAGVAGDQQAALFGQACVAEGMAKNTYGTGSFVLMNTGRSPRTSTHGLLTSAAWDLGDGLGYVLEGSIFITGAAVQWLRDGLGVISAASEAEPLAASVADAGGTYLVPAFVGLGAPHWDPYARGAYVGITRGTTKAHLARAAVEAMAYQTRDVVEAMASDAGRPLGELRVDGGASTMDLLCQIQADQLGVVVRRPANLETTALGAAFLAGLAEGVWSSAAELTWRAAAEFEPAPDRARADESFEGWKKAVERARDWARP